MDHSLANLVGLDLHTEKIALCFTHWERGHKPTVVKEVPSATLSALERTLKHYALAGADVVFEASANAFQVADRLKAAGFTPHVVNADVLNGMARKDRINDRIDARNLALVFSNDAYREVYVPSAQVRFWRSLLHAYEQARKATGQAYNQLWGFLNQHHEVAKNISPAWGYERLRNSLLALPWQEDSKHLLMGMLMRYEHQRTSQQQLLSEIARIVVETPAMQQLMCCTGISYLTAFAMVAHIGDVTRFAKSKQLVAYIGLHPVTCESGKDGGSHHLSPHAIRSLRALLTECAQAALRYGELHHHQWARYALARKKPRNVVICALARKMVAYAWHILQGHVTQHPDIERRILRKFLRLAHACGSDFLKQASYKNGTQLARQLIRQLPWAPSPEATASATPPTETAAPTHATQPITNERPATSPAPNSKRASLPQKVTVSPIPCEGATRPPAPPSLLPPQTHLTQRNSHQKVIPA